MLRRILLIHHINILMNKHDADLAVGCRQCSQMFQDEDYYMQIDSHMKFAPVRRWG